MDLRATAKPYKSSRLPEAREGTSSPGLAAGGRWGDPLRPIFVREVRQLAVSHHSRLSVDILAAFQRAKRKFGIIILHTYCESARDDARGFAEQLD